MKSFEYASPKTLKEATALLGEKWGEAEVLAGGTDLVTALKQQITKPKRLVSLKNIDDLKGIRSLRGALQVGAMTTLAELGANTEAQKHFPSLITAIENIGSVQITNIGTVGGDLCQRPRCWYYRNGFGLADPKAAGAVREGDNRYHAIFGTDTPALFVNASSLGPALIALGATFTAEGPNGKKREIKAADFFRAPKSDNEREIALEPNEILTLISIPMKGMKNATYEIRHRHGLDWPYVTASVAYREENGRIADAAVVLGHVAATPWRSQAAARTLAAGRVDDSAAERCGDAALEGAKPLSRNGYKTHMVKTAVKRAVLATRAA